MGDDHSLLPLAADKIPNYSLFSNIPNKTNVDQVSAVDHHSPRGHRQLLPLRAPQQSPMAQPLRLPLGGRFRKCGKAGGVTLSYMILNQGIDLTLASFF